MKLIKLSAEHYIIVDEKQSNVTGYFYDKTIPGINYTGDSIGSDPECLQITHSTQPEKGMDNVTFISLSEVKELLGEVDVEKKAELNYPSDDDIWTQEQALVRRLAYKNGYNQALEDNKDRKYTEEDMRKSYRRGTEVWMQNADGQQALFYDFLQSLQPTSWDVEFVDGKLKLI